MRTIAILTLGLTALIGVGCGKSDKDAIQGTWAVESAEMDGKSVPADEIKNGKFVFTGEKCVMEMAGDKQEETFMLDPSTKPKSINLTMTVKNVAKEFSVVGASIGRTVGGPVTPPPPPPPPVTRKETILGTEQLNLKGIYAIEGDTLKICVNVNQKDRPTEFTGKKGLMLVVLKRAK